MEILKLLNEKGYVKSGDYSKYISDAEKELDRSFSSDYRTYLENYAQLTIESHEFTGVVVTNYLNVVTATNDEIQYIDYDKNDIYVIELLGMDGIVIWQKTNGKIYQTLPNGKPEKIYESLVDYLENEVFKG